MVHIGLGAAHLDYWNLSPLELTALIAAHNGDKTEAEERTEEKENQRKLSAELAAVTRTA